MFDTGSPYLVLNETYFRDCPKIEEGVRPNHTFKLKGFDDVKTIILTGNFDNWDPRGYTMERTGDGWIINLYLKPGKYLYKFRIDGRWIIDPGNKLWEPNEFNTGNSVLWIE